MLCLPCRRCLLCGHPSPQGVCASCLGLWEHEQTWRGCTRCGHSDCAGCEALSGFGEVKSLLQLDTAMARLLLDAKDRHDLVAQRILESLCARALPKLLSGLVSQISHVVISPLRTKRLGTYAWHPALPLATLAQKHFSCVLTPYVRGVARQTTLTTAERQQSAHEGRITLGLCDRLRAARHPVRGVLFLDDVLTTGGVAERTRGLFPLPMQDAPWHIATLFRTPIARMNPESKNR